MQGGPLGIVEGRFSNRFMPAPLDVTIAQYTKHWIDSVRAHCGILVCI